MMNGEQKEFRENKFVCIDIVKNFLAAGKAR